MKCEKCGEYTEVNIDLSEIQVVYPKKEVNPVINLTDTIGITLKPLTLKTTAWLIYNMTTHIYFLGWYDLFDGSFLHD